MKRRPLFLCAALGALLLLPTFGRALAEDGYYTVAEIDGVSWFIDPQGNPFFSLGVSDTGAGSAPEKYDPQRPAYAAFHHYKSTDEWAEHTLQRLTDWKFNTLGGWSDASLTSGSLPYAIVLHLGSMIGFPWNDAFDDSFAAQIDKLVQRRVAPKSRDKNLLGWFTDNEQSWYPDMLFQHYLGQPSTCVTRSKLIDLLVDEYLGDFSKLKRDFEVTSAATFDELRRAGKLKLRPGGEGRRAILGFTGLLARRYYQVVHDAIRRHDPNHLILGDRYAWHCPTVVAKAAAPYVDVISTNFDWPEATDGYLPPGYLRNLHRVTGKPVLVTEYYVAAQENRSGNKNTGGIFLTVDTQQERTAAVENRLRCLVGQPYVIGAHWFRFADEPTHGRLKDGEDYNFGLVDIHNQPYDELVAAMARLHADVPRLHRESLEPNAAAAGPIAIPRVRVEAGNLHTKFVAARSLEPLDTTLRLYDLLVAWTPEKLYLAALVCDASLRETNAAKLPVGDHELEFTIASPQMRRGVRVGFGRPAAAKADRRDVECWHSAKGLRHTLVVALPAALLGKDVFAENDEIAVTLSLDDLLDKSEAPWQSEFNLALESTQDSSPGPLQAGGEDQAPPGDRSSGGE